MSGAVAPHRRAVRGGLTVRSAWWRAALAVALVACSASARPAARAPDTTRAEDWIRIDTPYFKVVSEASESRTRAWVVEFELFRRALEQFLPHYGVQPEPVLIVLFKSDRRFAAFKPLENGKPAGIGGFFARLPARNVIATSLDGDRDDARERIYHETVHWHLSAFDRALPLWLEEGLAEVLSSFGKNGSTYRLGRTRPYFVEYLKAARRLPFAQLAATERGELHFNGEIGEFSELFYVQAWAATHELLFSPDYNGLARLRIFLVAGPTSDDGAAEFEQIFRRTPAEMDRRLDQYLYLKTHHYWESKLDRSGAERGLVATPVSAVEIDRALGTVLLGASRWSEAQARFEGVLRGLPDDGPAEDALGEVALMAKREDEARAYFELARAHHGLSALGCYVLGEGMLRQSGTPGGLVPGLATEDVRRAADDFRAAVALNPRFRQAYEMLAATVCLTDAVAPEAEKVLASGVRWFPGNARIHLALGFAAVRRGALGDARTQLAAVDVTRADAWVGEVATRLQEEIDHPSRRDDAASATTLARPAGS